MSPVSTEEKALHVRRCHICGGITECEEALVSHCEHCGKPMAPFYFFDDREVQAWTDNDLRPPGFNSERIPVRGLTAYWAGGTSA